MSQLLSLVQRCRSPRIKILCSIVISILILILALQYVVMLGAKNSGGIIALNRVMCEEDSKIVSGLLESKVPVSRSFFYSIVMAPLQSACNDLKRFGGQWLGHGYDGGKYICMEDLLKKEEPCIIYSFGIGWDVSFEHIMIQHGCTIHAYDHTISSETKSDLERPEENFFIHIKGVDVEPKKDFTTFKNELIANNHSNAKITYLKVDIERGELVMLPHWVETGVLDKVMQIGIEFHSDANGSHLNGYFHIIQLLYKKGFKLISFDPNYFVGLETGFMTYFEVVFRKIKTACKFDEL